MSFWTADSIRAAAGGTWIARPPERPITITGKPDDEVLRGLCTDSRQVAPGQVFLALKGDRFDGHAFLADAVAAGASLLIVQDAAAVPAEGFTRALGIVRVADTRRALAKLAAAYRRTLERTKVIAVAGSNGKTTTTRLIDAVLSTRLRGTASPKSFNNEIGVPLTILSAAPTDQYLICEIGTNAPGEIAALGKVVAPDIAVITSIGREHLEGLGSLEGIAKEEASLLSYLRPGGVAVVTADSPALAEHLKRTPNLVTFGRADHADLRLTAVEHAGSGESAGLRFTVNGRNAYTVPLLGEHNALNAIAAIAVARRLGITDDLIAPALAGARGPEMRLQRLSIGGIDLINDAYNANPESMIAALKTLAAVGASAPRRVAIVGDMLELGPGSPDAHREIGQAILDLGVIDSAVIVGQLGLYTAERLSRGSPSGPAAPASGGGKRAGAAANAWPEDRYLLVNDLNDDRAAQIAALLRPGDTVLLKGSRRMRLERIVEALRERFGSGAAGSGGGAPSSSSSTPPTPPPVRRKQPA